MAGPSARITDILDMLGAGQPDVLGEDGWDRCGAQMRDSMAGEGIDPTDPNQLLAAMLGSFMALTAINNFGVEAAPSIIWMHCECLRRMLDGRITRVDASVLEELFGSVKADRVDPPQVRKRWPWQR